MADIKNERRRSDEFFRRTEEKYNCAQSILKAFQEEFGISDEEIKSFSVNGSGNAEGGLCGAAYAAEYLLKKANKKSILKEFEEYNGSVYCKEIDKKKISCRQRVAYTDKLIEERLKE